MLMFFYRTCYLLGSPYVIEVKDAHGKVILSGLEQILLTQTPCVIQGTSLLSLKQKSESILNTMNF
jgi:hypothetical protein